MPRVAYLALALALFMLPNQASAQAGDQQVLVEKAAASFRVVSQERGVEPYIKSAKALLIIPSYVRAGFFLGGEGGSGVLVVRGQRGWSDPAFYTMAGGSIGIQIGVEAKEMVFTLMTERAVNAVMSNQVKVGGEVSMAVGTVGAGAEASTIGSRGVDIYAFSRGVGLYGGAAFDGALIAPRHEWNNQYYGRQVQPRQIVLEGQVKSAGARVLHDALAAY